MAWAALAFLRTVGRAMERRRTFGWAYSGFHRLATCFRWHTGAEWVAWPKIPRLPWHPIGPSDILEGLG